jgi:hypothetical protein
VLQQGDSATELDEHVAWRTRRFPGLHLPNRAALAREWAVARGTSTRLLVTALRDPDFFTNTPAQAAAATGAWVPWLSFVHSQPEVSHTRTRPHTPHTHTSMRGTHNESIAPGCAGGDGRWYAGASGRRARRSAGGSPQYQLRSDPGLS